ncbi:MAG: Omp28-related outer membrane protein [Bacteroidales bacterium]|nr:Omp28-related outer membrane protein [Bacteroidales bacterium]
MKKILSFVAATVVCIAMTAQTFVDTTIQLRNAVIEEFTGVQCQYCSDGHKIVNEIIAANPGRVVAINIHTGGYATMYTTQYGDAIANQSGVSGYPSGTVNRHRFSGSSATALNRGEFESSANIIMSQSSEVNVAAKAHVNLIARTIEIDVEAYYTGNSRKDTNYLNVAIIQDNILGPQVGAETWYPEMMVGSQYRHNHMLRDLITGQWGEAIDTTTAGTFVSRHYFYQIPEKISNVEMKAKDLRVVVFMCESHQEILSGCEAKMSYYGLYSDPMTVSSEDCAVEFIPQFVIHNSTNERAADVTINYSYSGEANTYVYPDTIAPFSTDTISLPAYAPATNPQTNASYYVSGAMASYIRVLNATEYDTTIDNTYQTDTIRIDTAYTYDTVFRCIDTLGGHSDTTLYHSRSNREMRNYRNRVNDPRYICDTLNVDTTMSFTYFDSTYIIVSDTTIDTFDVRLYTTGSAASKIGLMNVYTVQGPLAMDLIVDKYSTETSVDFYRQRDCSVLFESDTIPDDLNRNPMHVYYHFDPDSAGLYILNVYDSYGDGNGGFRLYAGDGSIVLTNNGKFGNVVTYYLNVTNNGTGHMDGIETAAGNASFSLYPNPVRNELSIDCAETIRSLEVMDVTGRVVISQATAQPTVNTTSLPAGIYIMRVITDGGASVQKFVKE